NAEFPFVIAQGTEKIDGESGKIIYHFDRTTDIDRVNMDTEEFDFRNVMRIPTVEKKEKLATVIAPTKGKDGKNVHGKKIRAKAGRPAMLRPGKNVIFDEQSQSFISEVEGQVS